MTGRICTLTGEASLLPSHGTSKGSDLGDMETMLLKTLDVSYVYLND